MDNLKELITERDIINRRIDFLLKDEMKKIQDEYYGNSHTIEDISIEDDNTILLRIWYDDWERSQRVNWRIASCEG